VGVGAVAGTVVGEDPLDLASERGGEARRQSPQCHSALIDGTGRDSVDDGRIEIENGVIRDVSAGGAVGHAESGRLLDLRSWTVLPGLMDAHDHLCFDWSDPKELLTRESDAWSALRGSAVWAARPVI